MSYRYMRLVVMFDLPMDDKEDKREYTRFRKYLIQNGFLMLQYSVYIRSCLNNDVANQHLKKVKMNIPKDGHVRALIITEKQFEKMKVLLGTRSKQENLLGDKRFISF